MHRILMFAVMLGLTSSPLAAQPTGEVEDGDWCEACEGLLDLALDHPRRAADRPRDAYRNPAETLAFFRVEPGMTVVDVIPGGGWYTRILAPYLGDGQYIGLNPDVTAAPEGLQGYFGGFAEKFPPKAAEWHLPEGSLAGYNTDGLPDDLDGTADRVLIFREMHNLHRTGLMHEELNAYRGLLKDDGLLGIVQHRAKEDAPADYTDGNKGYMRERDVIGLVEAHGFELVAKSEINANPNDSADWPDGVWTLPPVLRTKENEEKYRAVGESDRMTLLFRKRD